MVIPDKEFNEIVLDAKKGEPEKIELLITMFMPLIRKRSIFNGRLDEDCQQALILRFIKCIQNFSVQNKDTDVTKPL